MRTRLLAGFCLALVLASSARAGEAVQPATSQPQTIVIGLDLSKSNPLVKDEAYAARAAARTARELLALPLRSRVMLRTFGSYGGGANGLKVDQVISARAKPQAVAEGIAAIIAHVPKLVAEGKLEAQGKTNIVPFLETEAEIVDCKAGEVRVILLTDGFEDSYYATLTRHGGKLPAPDPIYQGCDELMILGLGQGGGSPAATKHLRAAWSAYAEKAGFRRFTGLYDW